MDPREDSRIDDLAAWSAYRRFRERVDTHVARDLDRLCNLSMAEYDVLAAVAEMQSRMDCVRVRGLAAELDWAHSRLSRLLGRMEGRGLIAREPCELDGRGDDVLLTDRGRAAIDRARPAHEAAVREHLTGRLTPRQIAALIDIARATEKRPHPAG